MTIRKYLPPIQIHPILLIFIAIAFVTGTFLELFIIVSIVFIHELGHYTMAIFFKWKVHSVKLWIFGGVMDTDEHGNRPIHEDFLVTIAGPLQHLLIYFFIGIFNSLQILPPSILDIILFYNTVILLFNLLPIWPLDGGKLTFLWLSALLPYRKAYDFILSFSMIACLIILILQLFFFPFTLSAFLINIFLFMENRSEWKRRYFVFIRFLLRRYQSETTINGVHPIVVPNEYLLMDVFEHFRRGKKHPVYITYSNNERKTLDENDCLRSYFYDKKYNISIGDIAKQLI